jgi:hypothetical protein
MKPRIGWGCAALLLLLRLVTSPAVARAQEPERPAAWAPADSEPRAGDIEPPVIQYDLSGPRAGITVSPNGNARSQFGWHLEHQASPGTRGPWFVVETVVLVAGVEYREFVPNGTLVFGFRLPSGYEFGIGPSVTLGGLSGFRSSLVIAAGRSFRVGAIRVPVNLAVATDRDGGRVTFVTGWAIRDLEKESRRW